MYRSIIALSAALLATSALADSETTGDPAAGESKFRACAACHVVQNDAGDVLAGRNGKTGPNLYGLHDRVAGSVEGFNYGKDMVAAGEAGLTWDEDHFVAYVQDPNGFLRDYLGDPKARAKMTQQRIKEEDARNLYAYIVSLGE